jgi:hypothetical protein
LAFRLTPTSHYVTLFQAYEHVINPTSSARCIADDERRLSSDGLRLVVDRRAIHTRPGLAASGWQTLRWTRAGRHSAGCRRTLDDLRLTYRTERVVLSRTTSRRARSSQA